MKRKKSVLGVQINNPNEILKPFPYHRYCAVVATEVKHDTVNSLSNFGETTVKLDKTLFSKVRITNPNDFIQNHLGPKKKL